MREHIKEEEQWEEEAVQEYKMQSGEVTGYRAAISHLHPLSPSLISLSPPIKSVYLDWEGWKGI